MFHGLILFISHVIIFCRLNFGKNLDCTLKTVSLCKYASTYLMEGYYFWSFFCVSAKKGNVFTCTQGTWKVHTNKIGQYIQVHSISTYITFPIDTLRPSAIHHPTFKHSLLLMTKENQS